MTQGIFDDLVAAANRIDFGSNAPGQSPSITVGFGLPVANEATGSIYYRRDAAGATSVLYVRVANAWWPLASTSSAGVTPGTVGDGSLGDVVVTVSDPNFSGLRQYRNLTIETGVVVSPGTARVLIIEATESVTIKGTIKVGGLVDFTWINTAPIITGSAGGGSGGGGGGGGGGGAATDGVDGQPGNSAAGLAYFNQVNGIGGVHGALGVPGNPGSVGTAAVVGVVTQSWLDSVSSFPLGMFRVPQATVPGFPGGDGGAGGQGSVGAAGGAGGLGGTAGGKAGVYLLISAPRIVLTATGVIDGDGEAGAPGTNGSPGTNGVGAGDGGGGGGGGGAGQGGGAGALIGVFFADLVNAVPGNTNIHAAGGLGGAKGTGGAAGLGNGGGPNGGVGADGTNGPAGSPGLVVIRKIYGA